MAENEEKTIYAVSLSKDAHKILNEEEAGMLIKMLAPEFEKHEGKNAFGLKKLGIWVLKEKNELTIITDEEHKKHVK
ncbi:hypothetical protein COU37_00980 [Candidatus Micrarchaeota archaeon CG10_big_fil_rev_8_21_14_0_10_45_29]|nr:MAG: hypothetical protein COU37_00980 [Candidatus Micrarchaeota archaeon CG10_big_fil_rev_8_21_14_0_10_45_29]